MWWIYTQFGSYGLFFASAIDVYYIVCGTFFFFKQKTAYEMRISDWSSDVCSSDLMTAARTDIDASVGYYGVAIDQMLNEKHAIARPLLQIGRASCRERVCQYV